MVMWKAYVDDAHEHAFVRGRILADKPRVRNSVGNEVHNCSNFLSTPMIYSKTIT
ncbi:hypothetical protein RvY_05854 [Ramazzottius varieornatus]|uniref:Uncharacterized protein n=1 Tax=Ramazzottius varieornatus TaxID=947166 RepID=A0A1D1V023_RAMVA|nr:hypothetical protein RvY_05854 [Ramazzottius varieornatus]